MAFRSILAFVFSVLFCSHVLADESLWEYRDWKTEPITDDKYRYSTNGKIVHGNQFGFWVDQNSCSHNVLWLTISTYEKGLPEHIGEDVKIKISIDEQKSVLVDVPLVSVFNFNSMMDIAIFSNFEASDGFITALQKGNSVSFTIESPNEIESKFDIKTETFSLSGFTAHHLKAREACKLGGTELDIEPSITKEQM
jgi:hypothetical protein